MSLKALQAKIGVTPDGSFGPKTLLAAQKYFKMSDLRAAHFFGQCSHESGAFTVFSENLNYSAQGLLKTFPKYFNTATAAAYARKPTNIANRVYASRMGNGNEASGDGFKYRGRGAIQLTGKNNYIEFGHSLGRADVTTNPDVVANELSFDSAMFFFTKNALWSICDSGIDTGTITKLTKRINGGTNGLSDRIAKTVQYYNWIKKVP